MEKDGQVLRSLASIVKLKIPAAVDVPDNTPDVERVSTAGNVPDITLNVYEPVPPLAVNVCEYADPATPFGIVIGEIVIVGHCNSIDKA